MLNRRTLRIKAMQSLYALEQSKQANFNRALELVEGRFAPDLNSLEPQDKDQLQAQANEAKALLANRLNTTDPAPADTAEEIIEAVNAELGTYQSAQEKDLEHFRKRMVLEAEKVFDWYLLILLLPVELGELHNQRINRVHDAQRSALGKAASQPLEVKRQARLKENKVVATLEGSALLEQEALRRNVKWGPHRDIAKTLLKETLLEDETVAEYLGKASSTPEEDRELVQHIYKKLVFKSEMFNAFMAEQDISWEENKAVVRSMVTRTIKLMEWEEGKEPVTLVELSSNWEDDRDFFIEVFRSTTESYDNSLALIAEKATNWDLDRIATMDKIILSMAIAEMKGFPSIPVKVTINEYIELAKQYSTPKSKQFVNGLLDKLAETLQGEGKIKKSGRGLIDNR